MRHNTPIQPVTPLDLHLCDFEAVCIDTQRDYNGIPVEEDPDWPVFMKTYRILEMRVMPSRQKPDDWILGVRVEGLPVTDYGMHVYYDAFRFLPVNAIGLSDLTL